MKLNYENLLQNMIDGVYFVDKERRIEYWNKAAEKITGFSASEVVGSRCSDNILIHVDDNGNNLCEGMCPLAKTIEDGTSREAEVYLHHKNGYRVPVWVRVSPLTDESGTIVGGAELFTDSSPKAAMVQRVKELEELALIDALTRLSNRRHIESELEARFQEMKRYGLSFGILFMDIDHFKQINDTYGHDAGDRVLKSVADTLISIGRPFDQYGRWGGEEFIGIIRNVDLNALISAGNRCRVLIEKSYIPLNESAINVTVSVGATLAKEDDTAGSIIKRADGLMYKSKQGGRNRLTTDLSTTS